MDDNIPEQCLLRLHPTRDLRNSLSLWYEKLLPGVIVLHAMISYDRSIDTREAFVQEAASFVSFSDPRVGSARPARGASARHGPSGRQR